jgi:hypothetical protein
VQGCKRLSPGPRGAVAVSNRDPERTKTRLFDRRAKSNACCILVVNGDAMLDLRDLSIPIVQAKGDYLWTVYLDSKLVDLLTTYTTKLPPVRAHPVYHSASRPRRACPPHPRTTTCTALTLSGAWSLTRTGRGRGRGFGRRLTDTPRERLTVGRRTGRGDRFTAPADRAPSHPTSHLLPVRSCWGPAHNSSSLPALFQQRSTLVIQITQ